MSSKAAAGTCIDYIGTRCCVTGGFGTLAPEKRARCVADCASAIANKLTKAEFHAHNSFLVHLVDILNIDHQLLKGNWLPSALNVPDFTIIDVSEPRFARLRDNYAKIIDVVTTRPSAAFMSGITDAPCPYAPSAPGDALGAMTVRMASDCMTDEWSCAVFGHALEFEWFVDLAALDRRWLLRHINVGEALGAVLNVAVFGPTFSAFELIQEGDNTTEGAMVLGRARTPDQQYIAWRMRQTEGFIACENTLWFEHSAGLGQGFSDAGSRGYTTVLANLAAAFGRRRVRIDILSRPDITSLISDILDNTSEYTNKKRSRPPKEPKPIRLHTSADLRTRKEEEWGAGVARSALCTSASMSPGLSPTPPRWPARPALSAARHGAADHSPSSAPPSPALCRAHSPVPLRARLSPTPPARQSQSTEHSAAPRLMPSPARRVVLESSPRAQAVTRTSALRSPQPASAQAAYARAALEAGARLCDPSNPYAMGASASLPGAAGPSLLVRAERCARDGTPRNTAGANSWGFGWASKFCAEHDLPIMRPRAHDKHLIVEADEDRIAALMVFWIAQHMRPSTRRARAGYGQAAPPSAVQAVYGYHRVLRECGRHQPSMRAAAQVLKGLVAAYLREWGQDALAPRHHVPFALHVLQSIESALRHRAVQELRPSTCDGVHAAMCFCLARGPRLDEWTRTHALDTGHCRSNFCFVSGRTLVGSTQSATAAGALSAGTLLRVQNVPSKTDRSGAKWVGKFMWYAYDASNPLNFPAAWARYETAYPCPEEERRRWPAFSPHGDSRPFTPRSARAALRHTLLHVGGVGLADVHSWHDFRATVASALKLAGSDDATVQALVNWATAESVHLYGQLTPEAMAAAADLPTRVDASRHALAKLPHYCPESVAAEALGCAEAMAPTGAGKPGKQIGSLQSAAAHPSSGDEGHPNKRHQRRSAPPRCADTPAARTAPGRRQRVPATTTQRRQPASRVRDTAFSRRPPASPATSAPSTSQRTAQRRRNATAGSDTYAPAADSITPSKYPTTLSGYATYFDRPSTRRSPRARSISPTRTPTS